MSQISFKRAEKYDRIEEYIRLKFHTYTVTFLTLINVIVLGFSALLLWLSTWSGFPRIYIIDLLNISWSNYILLWNLPLLTWLYSTITNPIQKEYKYLIDWSKTDLGRYSALVLNIAPFILLSWVAAARYISQHYEPTLTRIEVLSDDYDYLLTTDLTPFIKSLYFSPFIVTVILSFVAYRHIQINKDIMDEQFKKWEMPLLSRFSHPLEMDKCDVIACYETTTKKPVVIKEEQRFLHEIIDGVTGSGKTSTAILLRIAQDLIRIATNRRKMGVVLLEPKGDAVDDVLKIAKKLGIPDSKIMVVDPIRDDTIKFNPFLGPLTASAISFQGSINALTADQDSFFKGQQNEATFSYTLLAKIRFGDMTNITHLQRMFTDPRYLADIVEDVKSSIKNEKNKAELNSDVLETLESWERVIRYFDNEVLEFKYTRVKGELVPEYYPPGHQHALRQVVENKKDKYVAGAKKYLNEIALNNQLNSLFISQENDKVVDLDKFLEEGGILLVNTALAELEELSLLFGQFFIRQFQSAVFRRPKKGRIPIFFNVDEFPLYVNEAFERLLTLGRSYKVGTLIALQSTSQLENVARGYRETILSNASSKTIFGRSSVEETEYFSKQFGEETVFEESLNESSTPISVENQQWGYRHNTQKKNVPRFTPTVIRELPFKHMIVQIVGEDNSIKVSTKAVGKFVNEARFLKKYFKIAKHEMKSLNSEKLDINKYVESEKFKIEVNTLPSDKAKKELNEPNKAVDQEKNNIEHLIKEDHSEFIDLSTVKTENNIQNLRAIHSVSRPDKETDANIDNLISEIQSMAENEIEQNYYDEYVENINYDQGDLSADTSIADQVDDWGDVYSSQDNEKDLDHNEKEPNESPTKPPLRIVEDDL